MKTALFFTIIYFLQPCFIMANETKTEAPKKILLAWAESFNKNDAQNFLQHYHKSDSTEVFVSNGLGYHSYQEYKKEIERDFQLIQFSKSRLENLKISRFGSTATASFQHKFQYTVLADKSQWRIHIRTTSTLIKTDQGWKITMEHSSPIKGIERAIQIAR